MTVTDPHRMNEAFARAFNSRSLDGLLALYEPGAVLRVDGGDRDLTGPGQIAEALRALLQAPGRMTATNRFCIAQGDLALLRADWEIVAEGGRIVAFGSSAELVRRQPDGAWRYVIDHAMGASLPRAG